MDCIDAIMTRRSCRSFSDKNVEEDKILKILECATYAPSPANKQPWEFTVVLNREYGKRLKEESEKTKAYLATRSGWKWLDSFDLEFVAQAPVLIVVTGDPSKNGAEQFLNLPGACYVDACSAAIQNICLAAHSLGLGSLWYTLYEKETAREIFGVEKDPVGIVCLGYPATPPGQTRRKSLEEKVRYIR